MPEFFGTCGRRETRKCKLAWSSKGYANKIGVYPSSLLPTQSTIWFASTDGGFDFAQRPAILPGETFGLALIGGLTLTGSFSSQISHFDPQSHFSVIFASSVNRINVPHILTQQEISSGQLNVGEYILEFVAVTDQESVINLILNDSESNDITTGESKEDKSFRKLFNGQVPDIKNRYIDIVPNRLGIAYRLDDGSPKSVSALDLAGIGDLSNSYRDGSSKIISVDLKKTTPRDPLVPGKPLPQKGSLQETSRTPRVGDTVFLTYVAVKKHYIRQRVDIQWGIQAQSSHIQLDSHGAYGWPVKVRVANFRFFDWTPQGSNLKLSGWRVVETFNMPVNFVAPVDGSKLGDFVMGGIAGSVKIPYMPTNLNESQIKNFISDYSKLPTFQINLNNNFFGSNYHENSGSNGNKIAFRNSNWFQRRNFEFYTNYNTSTRHIVFNTHPTALKRRDCDKWGIDRFLAMQVDSDIRSGSNTSFPFMDDPNLTPDDVINRGSDNYLDSSNFKIEPVQPLSLYSTANAEIDVGLIGGIGVFLAGNPQSSHDVVAVFNFQSNTIAEQFDKDTKILVERHFTAGENVASIKTLAIVGAPVSKGSVSCVESPDYGYSFLSTTNKDGLLTYTKFESALVRRAMENTIYRPDIKKNDIYEPLIGSSGISGDQYSYSDGKLVSASTYTDPSLFSASTTSSGYVDSICPSVLSSQIQEIIVSGIGSSSINIPLAGKLHCGLLAMDYSVSNSDVNLIAKFKIGSDTVGSVDFHKIPSNTTNKRILFNLGWIKANFIEITGSNIDKLKIINLLVLQSSSDNKIDFLDNELDTTSTNIKRFENLQLQTRGMFFATDVMSITTDNTGRIYIFFSDKNGGISVAQSNDHDTWYYHYGIVEKIDRENALYPFVVHNREANKCFLFYSFAKKILCKEIDFSLFSFEDAFIVEKYSSRITDVQKTTNGVSETVIHESPTIYSDKGIALRRKLISYVCAGDMTDARFLTMLGKNIESNTFNKFELHEIQRNGFNQMVRSLKTNLSLGTSTAFTNRDVEDLYFSAYRRNNGTIYLLFLGETDKGNMLQCHFSNDNGVTWFDLWEYAENRYNRLKVDPVKKTQFIDRSGSIRSFNGTDPYISNEKYQFGINVHWSRLTRHKIFGQDIKKGSEMVRVESKVLPVSAPYCFYHSDLKTVFLFYIYESCLLCKLFGDDIIEHSTKNNETDMSVIRKKIEQDTRSYFVDGDLSSNSIREEIHGFVNNDTKEIMDDGNIIFLNQYALDDKNLSPFTSERAISTQRVCAYKLSNGNVGVLYKNNLQQIRSSIWNGSSWIVEDLMNRSTTDFNLTAPKNYRRITGGFSS